MDKTQQYLDKAKSMVKQTAQAINMLLPDNEPSKSQRQYQQRKEEARQKKISNRVKASGHG